MDDFFISTGDDLLLGSHEGVILGGDENLLSESETLVGPPGPPGPAGQPGKDGRDGVDGQNATVSVGTTTTGAPGTSASVVNTGTTQNAVFNFTIPSGATGEQGPAGIDGIDGVDGFSPIASVEQTEYGAEITITDSNGTTTAQVVNGSQGEPGTPGTAATVSVGSTTTGAAGTSASVVNSGTSSAAILDFVIPRGADGLPGQDGQDGADGITPVITATASVDSSTGTPSVSVNKTGTDDHPQFYFAFEHLKGETGSQGPQGPAGTVDWSTSPIICGQKHIATASGWVPVSFGRTFSQPPIVCATLNTGTSQTATPTFIKVANITTTGFNVAIGSANGYGTGDVEWIAIDINRV